MRRFRLAKAPAASTAINRETGTITGASAIQAVEALGHDLLVDQVMLQQVATLGNAAELIITIFAIQEGLLDLVKASITGSIIGNALLVMGASLLFGGLKNGVQRFDRTHAGINATQLLLAVMALLIPSIFFFAHTETTGPVESLSLGTAVAMLAIYVLGLLFAFRYTSPEPELAQEVEAEHAGSWRVRKASLPASRPARTCGPHCRWPSGRARKLPPRWIACWR